jgi:hypothetical protein
MHCYQVNSKSKEQLYLLGCHSPNCLASAYIVQLYNKSQFYLANAHVPPSKEVAGRPGCTEINDDKHTELAFPQELSWTIHVHLLSISTKW